MMMNKTIGILTGGGDCAGLNAVIASIVKVGVPRGHRFVGFEKGWDGILERRYRSLDLDQVRGINHLGGTILGTTSRGHFAAKRGRGNVRPVPRETLEAARANLEDLGVDGLIAIGGDGTLAGAFQLAELGVKIVGVPKTIDNDLSGTDRTIGFSSAVDVAVESLDRIRTTAESHGRIFFVECMGRYSGWIALEAGLAGNAQAILLPEFPVDVDALVAFLHQRVEERGSAIVMVSEGIELDKAARDDLGAHLDREIKLQGASAALQRLIEHRAPGSFDIRTVVLGHTQRGGNPSAEDRILAKRFGVAALEACEQGEFNVMVRIRHNVVGTVSISEATGKIKRVRRPDIRYVTASKLGVFLN